MTFVQERSAISLTSPELLIIIMSGHILSHNNTRMKNERHDLFIRLCICPRR